LDQVKNKIKIKIMIGFYIPTKLKSILNLENLFKKMNFTGAWISRLVGREGISLF